MADEKKPEMPQSPAAAPPKPAETLKQEVAAPEKKKDLPPTPPTLASVLQAIQIAFGQVRIPLAPTHGVNPEAFRVTSKPGELNTFKNIKQLAQPYRLTGSYIPSQVDVAATLAKWGLDTCAASFAPLQGVIGYHFTGLLPWDEYVFAGTYQDTLIVTAARCPAEK